MLSGGARLARKPNISAGLHAIGRRPLPDLGDQEHPIWGQRRLEGPGGRAAISALLEGRAHRADHVERRAAEHARSDISAQHARRKGMAFAALAQLEQAADVRIPVNARDACADRVAEPVIEQAHADPDVTHRNRPPGRQAREHVPAQLVVKPRRFERNVPGLAPAGDVMSE